MPNDAPCTPEKSKSSKSATASPAKKPTPTAPAVVLDSPESPDISSDEYTTDSPLLEYRGRKWQTIFGFSAMFDGLCVRDAITQDQELSAIGTSTSVPATTVSASTSTASSLSTQPSTSRKCPSPLPLGQVHRISAEDMQYYRIAPKQQPLELVVCSMCKMVSTKPGVKNHMRRFHPNVWNKIPEDPAASSSMKEKEPDVILPDFQQEEEPIGSPSDLSATTSTCSNSSSSTSSSAQSVYTPNPSYKTKKGSSAAAGGSSGVGRSRTKSKHRTLSTSSHTSTEKSERSERSDKPKKSSKKSSSSTGGSPRVRTVPLLAAALQKKFKDVASTSASGASGNAYIKKTAEIMQPITIDSSSNSSCSLPSTPKLSGLNISESGTRSGSLENTLSPTSLAEPKEKLPIDAVEALNAKKKPRSPMFAQESLDSSTSSNSSVEYTRVCSSVIVSSLKSSKAAMSKGKDKTASIKAPSRSESTFGRFGTQSNETSRAVLSITNEASRGVDVVDEPKSEHRRDKKHSHHSQHTHSTASSTSHGSAAHSSQARARSCIKLAPRKQPQEVVVVATEEQTPPRKRVASKGIKADAKIHYADTKETDQATKHQNYVPPMTIKRSRFEQLVKPLPDSPASPDLEDQQPYVHYKMIKSENTTADELTYDVKYQTPKRYVKEELRPVKESTRLVKEEPRQQQIIKEESLPEAPELPMPAAIIKHYDEPVLNAQAEEEDNSIQSVDDDKDEIYTITDSADSPQSVRVSMKEEDSLQETAPIESIDYNALVSVVPMNAEADNSTLATLFEAFDVPSLLGYNPAAPTPAPKKELPTQQYVVPTAEGSVIYEVTESHPDMALLGQPVYAHDGRYMGIQHHAGLVKQESVEPPVFENIVLPTLTDFDYSVVQTFKPVVSSCAYDAMDEDYYVSGRQRSPLPPHSHTYAGIPRPTTVNKYGLSVLPVGKNSGEVVMRKHLVSQRKANHNLNMVNNIMGNSRSFSYFAGESPAGGTQYRPTVPGGQLDASYNVAATGSPTTPPPLHRARTKAHASAKQATSPVALMSPPAYPLTDSPTAPPVTINLCNMPFAGNHSNLLKRPMLSHPKLGKRRRDDSDWQCELEDEKIILRRRVRLNTPAAPEECEEFPEPTDEDVQVKYGGCGHTMPDNSNEQRHVFV